MSRSNVSCIKTTVLIKEDLSQEFKDGLTSKKFNDIIWGFPGGAVVRDPPANAGDMGSIPGPGRSHMPWNN